MNPVILETLLFIWASLLSKQALNEAIRPVFPVERFTSLSDFRIIIGSPSMVGVYEQMLRPIVKYPEENLLEKSEPICDFNGELRSLAEDMLETMYAAPVIGLAAPQVGVNKRLIVIDPTAGESAGNQLVLVNPKIEEESGIQKEEEGCLSLPGLTAVVKRPYRVRVSGYDLEGNPVDLEGEGLLARVLYHEIDHLDGILYLDRISSLKRDLLKRKIKKLMKAGEW
jgi:peptide deformylase